MKDKELDKSLIGPDPVASPTLGGREQSDILLQLRWPSELSPCENGKARKRRKRSLVHDLFKEFNANSTLHGLKYFTENDISLIERLFWIVTFVLSLGLCCSLIYNVWMKWQESPVIVSFSEKMIPVWQVPFPAFTICPRTKTQNFVYNFTENYHKFRNGSLDKR
ncbi:Pickpocket protein 28 [Eumeta japonica]|uniref:Pickpocket protein 28 n=1 Tax=Eumeta variegata TaxID=151549 RepID=A0A4C1VWV6_EUMVA|nr:Pickpocket protein 28 [Eumeta japonica]